MPPDTANNAPSEAALKDIPIDQDWNLAGERPLRLRLNLPPAVDYANGRYNAIGRSTMPSQEWQSRPLSQVTLFNSGGVVAGWRYGGKIEYRLGGLKPFGADVGGRLSTNSARLTFSWRTNG